MSYFLEGFDYKSSENAKKICVLKIIGLPLDKQAFLNSYKTFDIIQQLLTKYKHLQNLFTSVIKVCFVYIKLTLFIFESRKKVICF